jgi:C1q domain
MASIIQVDTIQTSGGTNAITFNSSGYINMPNQPKFYAVDGNRVVGTDQTVDFTNVLVNIGGGYNVSTYRFTAPVAGTYFFAFTAMSYSNNYNRFGLRKNGSLYGSQKFVQAAVYTRLAANWIITLAVNDYVDITTGISGDGDIHPNYRDFTGHLLG